jgi:hypothetical protein
LDPEVDVADVPHSGVADKCALASSGVDCVHSLAAPRCREQNAIGRADTQTVIILVYRYEADDVAISERDGVQRREIKVAMIRCLIKRAIGSKSDTSTCARAGVAYEGGNSRADVDGVQIASLIEPVTTRFCPVKHACARLEGKIADADWRPVYGDRTDRSDQAAGIGINLDERAGAAGRIDGRGKEAAVGMERNPGQAQARNRCAHNCAVAIYLIDGDQCAGINSPSTVTAVHRLDTGWRR